MVSFAEYAFNKSHAAAYAVIAYETAYLKAYYPVEFMAAYRPITPDADERFERGDELLFLTAREEEMWLLGPCQGGRACVGPRPLRRCPP